MKIISRLLARYVQFHKKRRSLVEERWKKYCLDNYGVFCNADELNQGKMLQIFWKVLEEDGYNSFNFNSKTVLHEPAKQSWGWDDLDGIEFLCKIEKIFGIYITDEEYKSIKTFGEQADLVIKRAKEKKQQEEQQQR